MNSRRGNSLIVIENGQLNAYALDNKKTWEVGRISKDNSPDINLKSPTVSRKHGKFENMDGIWFYLDYNGKNGTVYNKKHIEAGRNGKIKPFILKNDDIFVFGGGEKEIISHKTIWALYIDREFNTDWSTLDSKGYEKIEFITDKETVLLEEPEKGTIIDRGDGIAIYMGDLTYLVGNIKMRAI